MEHSGSATEESEHEGEDTPSLPSRDENKKPVSPIPVPVSIPQTKTVVPHPVPQPRPVELKLDHPKDLFGELPDSVLAANLPAGKVIYRYWHLVANSFEFQSNTIISFSC